MELKWSSCSLRRIKINNFSPQTIYSLSSGNSSSPLIIPCLFADLTSIGLIKTTDFVLTAALRYSSATPCSRRNTTFEPTSKQFAYGYTYHRSLLRCVVYTFPLAKSCHKRNSKMFFLSCPPLFYCGGF